MDVAALQLSIDSGDVVKATAALDKFSASATKAGASAKQGSIARLVQDYSRAADKVAQYQNAAMRAAAANDNLVAASRAASIANDNIAGATARSAVATNQATSATERHVSWLSRLIAQLRGLRPAADSATASVARSAGALQASTGNIAAQFQDIGVTAAMGMSPLMVALQQGTQLAAVFAQSGGNAFKALGGAILSVISPTSILTIGLVALVAAGIQMVDWAKLSQSALNAIASAMNALAASADALTPIIIAAGAATLVAFGPQIIASVLAIATAIGGALVSAISAATTAMVAFAVANPFTAIVLGVAAAGAAIAYFSGATIDDVKKTIDFVIGGFVGAFNTIKRTWAMLPAAIGDSAVQAVNWALRAITDLINKSIAGINSLIDMIPEFMRPGKLGQFGGLGQMTNPWAGSLNKVAGIAAEEMGKAHGVKYTDAFIKAVKGALGKGADAIRGFAGGIGTADDKKHSGAGGAAGAIAAETPTVDKWAELLANADKQQRALDQASAQIGVYGEDLMRLRHEQELFNQAQDKGITLIGAMSQELRDRAAALAASEYANLRKQASVDNARWHEEQMRQLGAEREAIGLTGEALIAYNYQQQLINKQLAAGIALKDIDIGKTAEQAEAYAHARAAIDQHTKAIADAREIATGFFTDWINGIRQGESVFKSFEKAVVNALNHIIDKLIQAALEQLVFNAIAALAGGGGGGSSAGLGSLGSSLGKLFANGGAFDHAQRFANGGAFTNRVITEPTLFRFAKGAQLGEMGEAGPEAIMPLSRDGNGRLGVAAHGSGSRKVEVNVNNTYQVSGAIDQSQIVEMIRQGGAATYDQVKRNLASLLVQYDRDGTL